MIKGRLISAQYAPGRGPRVPVGNPPGAVDDGARTKRVQIVVELKPAAWQELHERALAHDGSDDTAWLRMFAARIRGGCDCRTHWAELLTKNPPDFRNYFAWTVARHNDVNRRLGKPHVHLAAALLLWAPKAAALESQN